MLLARDQGYFQEQGIEAELTQVKTNVGITALLNGELDYTESVGTNIRTALQGAPIKTVLASMRAPVFMLVARPEFDSVARLRGRTVGITNFGGSNEQTTRLIFEHYGLEPQRDVQPERAGIETILKLEQEDGPTPAPATFDQVADATVAAEAQAELGLRR